MKLPEGQYEVIEKSTGPFSGAYSEYLGKRWLKLSYPNIYDAQAGFQRKQITPSQLKAFERAHQNGTCPPQNTSLGGGIGIHGWAGNWPEGERHLTWGCISMQNEDLVKFYEKVPLKTNIYIFP